MQVDVTAKGNVPPAARQQAAETIGGLDRFVNAELLRAHVVLRQEANPRIERSAHAEAEVLLDGTPVRAHVADLTMDAAINRLAQTLERQLRNFVERRVTERDRPDSGSPGEWRHGDRADSRPSHLRRPPEEREIVRRKTFAIRPLDPTEAVEEMQILDHDFYLFRELDSDVDAVVYRRDDGRLGVIGPAETGWSGVGADGIVREASRMSEPSRLEDAIAEMNVLDHRFLYFVDAESGRGRVIYLRFDGDYGLIEPRDPQE